MDTSNLVCHYHKKQEAMGVCPKCMKKLCLECYLVNDDNTCKDCAPKKNNKQTTAKKSNAELIMNKYTGQSENKKELKDPKVYRNTIIKLVIEILIGALFGYVIGFFFLRYRTLYFVIAFLSLVPTFHFINRVETSIFGHQENTTLRWIKYFIKFVFALIFSSCLIGFIFTLFEIYANTSLLIKAKEKEKNTA